MQELHLSAGDVARVAVEKDDRGSRVLLRLGNGRYRPMSPAKARLLSSLLLTAAIECEPEHPAPTSQPVAARPEGDPRVLGLAPPRG